MADQQLLLPISAHDLGLIVDITDRAERELGERFSTPEGHRTLIMDLAAVHKTTPLAFECLLDAPLFDFSHDIWGITYHLDRQTGHLKDCFSLRFEQTYHPKQPCPCRTKESS